MKAWTIVVNLTIFYISKCFGIHTYQKVVNNITFEKMDGFDLPKLPTITHLEIDYYNPGGVLFSTEHMLFSTTDLSSSPTHLIGVEYDGPPKYKEGNAENAHFGKITSFAAYYSNFLLVVDSANNVIRLINRQGNVATSLEVGLNGSLMRDLVDGSRLNCRLYKPDAIALYQQDNQPKFVISEPEVFYIAVLDYTRGNGYVTHYSAPKFSSIAIDFDQRLLYFATDANVVVTDHRFLSFSEITNAARTGNYTDGSTSKATFNLITDILVLNTKTLLVLDSMNQRLRVVDRKNNEVSSICMGGSNMEVSNGVITECVIRPPQHAILFSSNLVLVITIDGKWWKLHVKNASHPPPINVFSRPPLPTTSSVPHSHIASTTRRVSTEIPKSKTVPVSTRPPVPASPITFVPDVRSSTPAGIFETTPSYFVPAFTFRRTAFPPRPEVLEPFSTTSPAFPDTGIGRTPALQSDNNNDNEASGDSNKLASENAITTTTIYMALALTILLTIVVFVVSAVVCRNMREEDKLVQHVRRKSEAVSANEMLQDQIRRDSIIHSSHRDSIAMAELRLKDADRKLTLVENALERRLSVRPATSI